ncbi:MAG: hypothetical protein ACLR7J_06930 [[Ruminococcus] torques]
MTKIKFCGLFRRCDIEAVNELKPEYIGFVFVKTSKRYVSFEKSGGIKKHAGSKDQGGRSFCK